MTVPILIGLGSGLCCGRSRGSPTTGHSRPPFTGAIRRAAVDGGRREDEDREAEIRMALARQYAGETTLFSYPGTPNASFVPGIRQ